MEMTCHHSVVVVSSCANVYEKCFIIKSLHAALPSCTVTHYLHAHLTLSIKPSKF